MMVLEVEGITYQRLQSNLRTKPPEAALLRFALELEGFERLARCGGGHGACSPVPRRVEVIDHCFCKLGEGGRDGEVGGTLVGVRR